MSEPTDNGPFAKHRFAVLLSALIVAVCVAAYWQVLGFDFINIDDRPYIYENPAVLAGLNWRSFKWAFTAFYSANWHPLTWLSHMADVTLFGLEAGKHHAVNALIHTINSLLLLIVLRRLTGRLFESGVVALLFAVHPTHVESVAWVAERKDVLSTLFWLLTTLAYHKYLVTKPDVSLPNREPNKWFATPRFWMVVTTLLFACGLMSKPMLVTLPFTLLILDYWPLGRLRKPKDLYPLLNEKIPLFVLTIASSIITLIAQGSFGATVGFAQLPIGTRLANATIAYAKYILMMFYPADLGVWYPFDSAIDPLYLVASAALLFLISLYCWVHRKKRPYLIAGWLWFIGTLVPVIGLVQVGLQSMADRYTYVPYIGLFIMVVWGVRDLLAGFKINAAVHAAIWGIIIVALGVACYKQVGYWKNGETLYTHTLSFTKNNYFLLSNLCLYYVKQADAVTADRHCTELLGQTPPSAEAFNILGLLRLQLGRNDEAAQMFQNALRLNPNLGLFNLNMALAQANSGKPNDAEKYLQRAVGTKDGSVSDEAAARAMIVVGDGFARKNDLRSAGNYYQRALELKPDLEEARTKLEKLSPK